MISCVKFNMSVMLRRKMFWFSFVLMMLISVTLPIYKLVRCWGQYEYELPSAESIYICANGSSWWSYISLILPILLIMPYCLSYMEEFKSGVKNYVQVRMKKKQYYWAQAATCFLGTELITMLPFLVNNILNFTIFPVSGNENVTDMKYYTYGNRWCWNVLGKKEMYKTLGKGILLKQLYIDHPFWYTTFVAIVGAVILGVFTVLFYIFSIRLKKASIWLMLISYLSFQFFVVLDKVWESNRFFGVYVNMKIIDYCAAGKYIPSGVYYPIMGGIALVLSVFIWLGINRQEREDEV